MEKCLGSTMSSPQEAEAEITRNFHRSGGLDLLVLIMPDTDNTAPYGAVKLLCETKLGVVSQVVLAKHASAAKPQYLANVLLKINAKVNPSPPPARLSTVDCGTGPRTLTLLLSASFGAVGGSQPAAVGGDQGGHPADLCHPHLHHGGRCLPPPPHVLRLLRVRGEMP